MLERFKKFLYRNMSSNDISYKTAMQMMKKDSTTILLDVRSKQEYDEGHLPYSICICLYDLEKEAYDKLKDKSQTIIVYCSSGTRSKEAQEILEQMGYENVYNLKGGLDSI